MKQKILCLLMLSLLHVAQGDEHSIYDRAGDYEFEGSQTGCTDKFRFRVTSSGGFRLLNLAANGRVIADYTLPWREDKGFFNISSAFINCQNDQSLEILSRMPGRNLFLVQKFAWQDKKLTYLSNHWRDPSEEIIEQAVDNFQNNKELESSIAKLQKIMYPDAYITPYRIRLIIKQAHLSSLKLYRAGHPEQASELLRRMFDLTAELIRRLWLESNEDTPEKWLEAWDCDSIALRPSDYVAALNDYAYFLQKQKLYTQAIKILRIVHQKDPERVVTYLNLADSLWHSNKRQEAKSFYRQYARMMESTELIRAIPQRVRQRQS